MQVITEREIEQRAHNKSPLPELRVSNHSLIGTDSISSSPSPWPIAVAAWALPQSVAAKSYGGVRA